LGNTSIVEILNCLHFHGSQSFLLPVAHVWWQPGQVSESVPLVALN
jgi:hypothetical protein